MIHIYGIKNCDTMKKAFTWLNDNGIEYAFHDYKKESVKPEKLKEWLAHFDLWSLINTKGTTWRQLPDTEKAVIQDQNAGIAFLQEKTSAIKRPIVEYPGGYLFGFNPEVWEKTLN